MVVKCLECNAKNETPHFISFFYKKGIKFVSVNAGI